MRQSGVGDYSCQFGFFEEMQQFLLVVYSVSVNNEPDWIAFEKARSNQRYPALCPLSVCLTMDVETLELEFSHSKGSILRYVPIRHFGDRDISWNGLANTDPYGPAFFKKLRRTGNEQPD